MKRICTIILAFGFMGMPLVSRAATAIEIIEIDNDAQKTNVSLRIVTSENGVARLRITNAYNQTVQIFDISGTIVKKFKVDSQDKTVELNLRKGCYIVKVGNVVRKVSVS